MELLDFHYALCKLFPVAVLLIYLFDNFILVKRT